MTLKSPSSSPAKFSVLLNVRVPLATRGGSSIGFYMRLRQRFGMVTLTLDFGILSDEGGYMILIMVVMAVSMVA